MKETSFEEIKDTISCMLRVMKSAETREVLSRAYFRVGGAISAFNMTGLLTVEEERELTKLNMDTFSEIYNLVKE